MRFAVLTAASAAMVLTLACSSAKPAASSTPTSVPTTAATSVATAAATPTATPTASSAPAASSVTVTADEVSDTHYQYDPSTLTFKTGDTTVHFQNKAGNQRPHTFTIRNAAGTEVFRSDRIQPGNAVDLKITLPDAGTYKFVCVVQGHEDKGQVGTLTVTKG